MENTHKKPYPHSTFVKDGAGRLQIVTNDPKERLVWEMNTKDAQAWTRAATPDAKARAKSDLLFHAVQYFYIERKDIVFKPDEWMVRDFRKAGLSEEDAFREAIVHYASDNLVLELKFDDVTAEMAISALRAPTKEEFEKFEPDHFMVEGYLFKDVTVKGVEHRAGEFIRINPYLLDDVRPIAEFIDLAYHEEW